MSLPTNVLLAAVFVAVPALAGAAEVVYEIDPAHTYPSFEADHMGLSSWRGKFNASSGRIVLDREAGRGTVDVAIDIASIDFGHDEMNAKARTAELFDADTFPQARYRGRLAGFVGGAPTRVDGTLELHGKTQPLSLSIDRFTCMKHPIMPRELCGADASAVLDRAAFGIDAGKDYGFDMKVVLKIQVEALGPEPASAP
ncbi:MAG: polyisoprenoid-binding protein [Lysobacteraceae bacterium]|nr:MAG: polyisoprenoid-binding protein [Xanthomonadaceae bacterium]